MSDNNKSQQFFNTTEQFINKIFICPNIMYKHIEFMRCFPDIEWFNIAAILLQKPDAVFVKSKASWDEYCDKNVLIKKSAKAIRTAVPSVVNNLLDFDLIPLFDISDINYTGEVVISSPIKIKVDSYDGVSRINNLFSNINTSFSECLISNISDHPFFLMQKESIQKIIIQYVLKSVESFLDEKITVESIEEIENPLEVYHFIYECISLIPNFIDEALSSIVYREQELKSKEALYKTAMRSIQIRKDAACKKVNNRVLNTGKEIITIPEYDEIQLDEEGIPFATEREVYGG